VVSERRHRRAEARSARVRRAASKRSAPSRATLVRRDDPYGDVGGALEAGLTPSGSTPRARSTRPDAMPPALTRFRELGEWLALVPSERRAVKPFRAGAVALLFVGLRCRGRAGPSDYDGRSFVALARRYQASRRADPDLRKRFPAAHPRRGAANSRRKRRPSSSPSRWPFFAPSSRRCSRPRTRVPHDASTTCCLRSSLEGRLVEPHGFLRGCSATRRSTLANVPAASSR